jgi:adenylate cyclase
MFVISRNTAFAYRNKPVEAKQIGRELGVRYVLEGSVRRSGDQVRVNAQLVDAETDAHLWADRFDHNTSDLFALQNEITSRIAVALNLELIAAEAARPSYHPDALDYILQGRAAWAKAPTRDNYREVIDLFERALALDPLSVEAQSLLATVLANRVPDYMSDSTASDIERSDGLIEQALATSPRSPLAHWAKGQLLTAKYRYDEAIPEYETVIAFNRNSADAYSNLGWCKLYTGSIEETIPLQEQAIRLSPRDPSIGFGIGGLRWCTCCNRASRKRSSGSKRRAVPMGDYRSFTPTSAPRMLSKAKPNAPPPNSRKPKGSAIIIIRPSPA